jgi:hypothetical protein
MPSISRYAVCLCALASSLWPYAIAAQGEMPCAGAWSDSPGVPLQTVRDCLTESSRRLGVPNQFRAAVWWRDRLVET